MSYNFKYLKYKHKYLDLKKLIGAGLEAICELNEKNIIITYKSDDKDKELHYEYNPEDPIGSGTYGTVYKIKKLFSDDDTEYIFKMKIPRSSEIFKFKGMVNYDYPIVKEGTLSDLLKEILDTESLIIFQGKIMSNTKPVGEFLIHPKIAKFTPPFLINNNNLTSLLFLIYIIFFIIHYNQSYRRRSL